MCVYIETIMSRITIIFSSLSPSLLWIHPSEIGTSMNSHRQLSESSLSPSLFPSLPLPPIPDEFYNTIRELTDAKAQHQGHQGDPSDWATVTRICVVIGDNSAASLCTQRHLDAS